jgi:porin
MKSTIQLLSLLGISATQMLWASPESNSAVPVSANSNGTNITQQVQVPGYNALPQADDGIFAKQGQWLADHGIKPHLSYTQMRFANPGVGVRTGSHEDVQIIAVGSDFDLEKILGLKGTTIRYESLFAPGIDHTEWGNDASSSLVGVPGPYLPQTSHLTLFTLEQKLLQDKLTVAAGKSNAGNFFARPLCNMPLTCVSASLQDIAGLNPPPYSNWSVRLAYDLSPTYKVQAGWWRSNDAYPFTNGWEKDDGKSGGEVSNVYLASFARRSNFALEKYPLSYEIMGFYNDATQYDPRWAQGGGTRASIIPNTYANKQFAKTSEGVGGFFAGVKKTIWRADHGDSNTPFPKSIALYASMTHNFNDENTRGIQTQGNSGVIFNSLFASRPFDSYSLNFSWARLTDDMQGAIIDHHIANGGTKTYDVGQTETVLTADANFILYKGVILSPFVHYSWNSNKMLDLNNGIVPESGLAYGISLHLQLDRILGLSVPAK